MGFQSSPGDQCSAASSLSDVFERPMPKIARVVSRGRREGRARLRGKGAIGDLTTDAGGRRGWGSGVREAREHTHPRGGARADPESVANIFSVGFVVNARVLVRRRRDPRSRSCSPLFQSRARELQHVKSALVALRFADPPIPQPHRVTENKSRRSASTRFNSRIQGSQTTGNIGERVEPRHFRTRHIGTSVCGWVARVPFLSLLRVCVLGGCVDRLAPLRTARHTCVRSVRTLSSIVDRRACAPSAPSSSLCSAAPREAAMAT